MRRNYAMSTWLLSVLVLIELTAGALLFDKISAGSRGYATSSLFTLFLFSLINHLELLFEKITWKPPSIALRWAPATALALFLLFLASLVPWQSYIDSKVPIFEQLNITANGVIGFCIACFLVLVLLEDITQRQEKQRAHHAKK